MSVDLEKLKRNLPDICARVVETLGDSIDQLIATDTSFDDAAPGAIVGLINPDGKPLRVTIAITYDVEGEAG